MEQTQQDRAVRKGELFGNVVMVALFVFLVPWSIWADIVAFIGGSIPLLPIEFTGFNLVRGIVWSAVTTPILIAGTAALAALSAAAVAWLYESLSNRPAGVSNTVPPKSSPPPPRPAPVRSPPGGLTYVEVLDGWRDSARRVGEVPNETSLRQVSEGTLAHLSDCLGWWLNARQGTAGGPPQFPDARILLGPQSDDFMRVGWALAHYESEQGWTVPGATRVDVAAFAVFAHPLAGLVPASQWDRYPLRGLWCSDFVGPDSVPPETATALADLNYSSFCRCLGYRLARTGLDQAASTRT